MSENGVGGGAPDAQRPGRRAHPGLIAVVTTIVIACVVLVVMNASIFKVATIKVEGNVTRSATYIAELSGVIGKSVIQLRAEDIKKNIEADRYLTFVSLERQGFNGVQINVRERIPCANLVIKGVMYLIDDACFVLERSDDIALDNGYPVVIGLRTKLIRVGDVITPSQSEQMALLCGVLRELAEQNYISQISDLDIADMDKLYLNTVDGFSVYLGDGVDLRAKIRTMRATVAKLRVEGYSGGSIEASKPGISTYTPPNL